MNGVLEKNSLKERLRTEFPFFGTLDEAELEAFLEFCEPTSKRKGENLWVEGDTENFAAFIVSGRLGIKKKTEFDKHIIVGIFSRGTVAGELCLLTSHARSVTAVVLDDVEVLKLTSEDFERMISRHPMLGLKLLRHIFKVISHRLTRSTERMARVF